MPLNLPRATWAWGCKRGTTDLMHSVIEEWFLSWQSLASVSYRKKKYTGRRKKHHKFIPWGSTQTHRGVTVSKLPLHFPTELNLFPASAKRRATMALEQTQRSEWNTVQTEIISMFLSTYLLKPVAQVLFFFNPRHTCPSVKMAQLMQGNEMVSFGHQMNLQGRSMKALKKGTTSQTQASQPTGT